MFLWYCNCSACPTPSPLNLLRTVGLLHRELSVPVTCKIRVFEEVEKTVKYAQMLESAGCQVSPIYRTSLGPLCPLPCQTASNDYWLTTYNTTVRVYIDAGSTVGGGCGMLYGSHVVSLASDSFFSREVHVGSSRYSACIYVAGLKNNFDC